MTAALRIAVIHNLPADPLEASESAVVEQAQAIEAALLDAGHRPLPFALRDLAGLLAFLAQAKPDLVFNCCEALAGNAAMESHVAAVFEMLGLAFTGSSALTLGLCQDKALAKAVLAAHGVPTPAWWVLAPGKVPELAALHRPFIYPLIVKPLREDASLGIDEDAVVDDEAALLRRSRHVWERFEQPALAEAFVDGRELNVALLANASGELECLPISEIVFHDLPHARQRIVGYDAKWRKDSLAYQRTEACCPARLAPALAQRAADIALGAAAALGLRGYARIDLRVRAADEAVFVLEANPNPDIGPDSGFMRAALASGRSPAQVVSQIVACALRRR